jgi:hypothetical protein
VLNRLYIVIGVLVILAISAAFIVPRFIQWGDYRGRMEQIAGEVLGADVEIAGDIAFSLLPQPKMQLSRVVIGPAGAPSATIAEVEAEFSLFDFLRDRYLITRLVLSQPEVALRIDASGRIDTGVKLPGRVSSSNISAQGARVVDGVVQLLDTRSGQSVSLRDIDGELRLDALRGPFGFAGTGNHEGGQQMTVRVLTSALDDDGGAQLSVLLRPADDSFTMTAEGRLTTGVRPGFSGEASFRRPPARVAEASAEAAGSGAMVVSGKLDIGPDRALMPALTIVPDENRPGTRLTGLAEFRFGEEARFNAIIEGAAMALPPRDATAERVPTPYELVRLLGEIPAVPLPDVAGTVRVDIGEVNLRAVTLRRVRFDATTDARRWRISDFSAQLPGNARLTLEGLVYRDADERTAFDGEMTLSAQRLDSFAAQWRGVGPGASVLSVPGRVAGHVLLEDEALKLDDATLTLDGVEHAVAGEIGFGPSRYLSFSAGLDELSLDQSLALAALMPDATRDSSFVTSFPRGSFAIAAQGATLFGLNGRGLSAQGSWDGGVLEFSRLSATDIGGAAMSLSLTAFGTLARPELSGRGTLTVSADAPALSRMHEALSTAQPVQALLARLMPADLALELSPPDGNGGQTLTLAGRGGATVIDLEASLGEGIARALTGALDARLELRAGQADVLARQLGLPALSIGNGEDGAHFVATAQGRPSQRLTTSLLLEAGQDLVGFTGEVQMADTMRPRGAGRLEMRLADAKTLLAQFGASGIAPPGFDGSATIAFDGDRSLGLTDIAIGAADGEPDLRGSLAFNRDANDRGTITGQLTFGTVPAEGLFSAMAGPAALVGQGEGLWPEGPIDLGSAARQTSGRVRLSGDTLTLGDRALEGVDFDFDWDATTTRLRGLSGRIGGGTVDIDMTICCAGPFAAKQVSGRGRIDGVAIDAIAPPAVAAGLEGTLTASLRFDGTGESLADAVAAMTGDGSYAVAGLTIAGLDAGAFAEIASLDNIFEIEPAALTEQVEAEVVDGMLQAPSAQGGFTIAGGVLRSPSLAIDAGAARLFGSSSIRLETLGLDGAYTLTPTAPLGTDGLINETTGRIVAQLGGTLLAPERRIDAATMVDSIMVRALEIEVDRLEQLRAEQEARAAEARQRDADSARQAEQEAARLAQEEADRQAREEADRLAAEDAARLAEEEAARQAQDAAAQQEQEEAARLAAEAETARLAEEARRAEAQRAADEAAAAEQARQAAEARRRAEERELLRRALDNANRPQDIGLGTSP